MKHRQSFSPSAIPIASVSSSSHFTCAIPAFALSIVDGIHKASVVPVLDDVVWTVMDLHLNGVPAVVDQEDYAVLCTANHC
ncbi:Os03g0293450 [Oryza sativa Japonica Group]|uniref:Os03g0293450 protein n=1 Tax=Oryza sativa subsp. japonica TaxID=39947 RepID=A0A0N7KH32_ORYSJ|nr:hypothetical protein EE612_016809 [Oryza sativa]BAS83689.1 Os03g0293450 [Oryza sativa Japonica Group]